jgi:hypothetical protein
MKRAEQGTHNRFIPFQIEAASMVHPRGQPMDERHIHRPDFKTPRMRSHDRT